MPVTAARLRRICTVFRFPKKLYLGHLFEFHENCQLVPSIGERGAHCGDSSIILQMNKSYSRQT